MDNPYKPPQHYQGSDDSESDSRFGLYTILNILYAAITLGGLLILLFSDRLVMDHVSITLFIVFLAPTFSYLIVRSRAQGLLRLYLPLHLLLVVGLLGVFISNLDRQGLNQGIGYYIILVNTLSLAAAYYRWRRLSKFPQR